MTNTSFNLENGIFLPFSPEATGVGIPGQFTTWSTDNKIGPAGTPSGALLDQLTGFSSTGILQRNGAGAYSFLPPFIGSNTAAITGDGANITAQNSVTTASGVYSSLVPGGWAYRDVSRAVGVLPASSTVQNLNGFGSYILNNCVSSGSAGNAVGFFGLGVSAINGASTWGANFALNDSTNNASLATAARTLIGIEVDFTVASNNAGTAVQGYSAILHGLFGNVAAGNAFQASITSGSLAKWTYAFVSPDGASATALFAGALATTGSSIASQPLTFGYRDSGGTGHMVSMSVNASGVLSFPNQVNASAYQISNISVITVGGSFSVISGPDGRGRLFVGDTSQALLYRASNGFFFQNDGGTDWVHVDSTGVVPASDNAFALGSGSARWSSVNTLNLIAGSTVKGANLSVSATVLVSALGSASTLVGFVQRVSDGTAALALGATVTGGGSTPYLVWSNGTAWTIIGK